MLYASSHEEARVRNLVLLATPIDFGEMGTMVAGVLDGRVEVEDVVDETGNIPAGTVYGGFFMQAPTVEVARHATLLENLWNDEYVEGWEAMAQWSRDHVPFPGAAARQIIDELVRRNVLDERANRARRARGTAPRRSRRGPQRVCRARQRRSRARRRPELRARGRPRRRHELRLGGGHVTFSTGRRAFNGPCPR